MKITFLGAAKTVTGSKYLVDTGTQKILIDCGLFQGHHDLVARNWQHLLVNPQHIDAVILTHAHIDHCGYIPLLIKNGFSKQIYCSPATKDLCSILLMDAAYIQEEQAREHKTSPLYTLEDAMRALKRFHVTDFEYEAHIEKAAKFTLYPAGHILGASFVVLKSHGTSLLFSGDIGRFNDPVMEPPANCIETDFMVLESTYGAHLHGTEDPLQGLAEYIHKTFKRGGTLIIPSFAVGRAQTLLYLIQQLQMGNRIPKVPIYLDSPMAISATELFYKYADEHRLGKKLARQVCSTAINVLTQEDSFTLSLKKGPKVIISASGMAEGGRVLNHIKQYGTDPKNAILFTGFQVAGTRGHAMINGAKETIIDGIPVSLNAEIGFLHNMSAHSDYNEIIKWLETLKKSPKKVFLIHGESASSLGMQQKIEEKFGWKCIVPEIGQVEDLG